MANIEQNKLRALLNQPVGQIERQPDCPDDYQLASYMEGGLSERDHVQFEAHLADCTFCIERVGALGRAGEAASVDATPEAQRDQSHRAPKSRRATRWATAALVVMAVGFIANQQIPDRGTSILDTPQNQSATTERFIEQASPFPEILSPLEGGLVDPRSFVFRWKEVPGSLFYDIRIVSEDGAQIARQRVWDTQWSLPRETQLQVGEEYFVRVDAFISEGKAVSSEHTVFKVGNTRP